MSAPAFGGFGASIPAWTSGINHMRQKKENDRNRDFEIMMWNANNAYNTPLAQRQRLEAGGFNPNTMFGNGSIAGNSSPANMPEGKIHPIDTESLARAGSQVYEPEIKLAQAQVLQEQAKLTANQIDNVMADTVLKNTSALNTAAQTGKTGVETEFLKRGLETSLQMQSENVKNTQLRNAGLEIENTFSPKEKQSSLNLQKQQGQSLEASILKVKQETKNLSIDAKIKAVEAALEENGINRNSPTWQRILSQFWDKAKTSFTWGKPKRH